MNLKKRLRLNKLSKQTPTAYLPDTESGNKSQYLLPQGSQTKRKENKMASGEVCESPMALSGNPSQPPVLDRLKRQKAQAEEKVDNLDRAIRSLEEHPEVYKVLEALNKLGHY